MDRVKKYFHSERLSLLYYNVFKVSHMLDKTTWQVAILKTFMNIINVILNSYISNNQFADFMFLSR